MSSCRPATLACRLSLCCPLPSSVVPSVVMPPVAAVMPPVAVVVPPVALLPLARAACRHHRRRRRCYRHPSPSSSSSYPIAPSPSSSSSINRHHRRLSRRRHPRRRRPSPVANFVLVVSRRAVARHAVECLCRAAAADARDNATLTPTVLLQ